MQPMWYSTDVWHKCALVCAEIKVNTNKLNVCLINPENICLRPTHHIRHIPRILVNYRYNLTNMRVVIIQLVRIKLVLAESVCHTYLWSLSVYIYSGMSIDTVDISLLLLSTYTGKPTMFMNVSPFS